MLLNNNFFVFSINYLNGKFNFLQWLGESDLRYKMQGRLILVHLMCRDMAAPSSAEDIPDGISEEENSPSNG